MRIALLALVLAPSLVSAQPAKPKVTVTMSAATLADDCGHPAVPVQPGPSTGARADSSGLEDPSVRARGARAKRACEQTSMQLAIKVPNGVATTFKVKKVEIFDDQGKSIGELAVRSPAVWSTKDSVYRAWDEKLTVGDHAVTYTLSAPKWSTVGGRWNKTYTVKAVVLIGGADQAVDHKVYIQAQTSLPPNVRT